MKRLEAISVAALLWLSVGIGVKAQDKAIEPAELLDRTETRHLRARRNLERILREQPEFWPKLQAVAARLETNPAWLLNVIASESLFISSARNPLPGQTASGLLQIIEPTAHSLQTTTEAIRRMSPVEQLLFIERYLTPFRGRLKTLADIYSAVFRGFIPDGDATVVILDSEKELRKYGLNRSLDLNRDGRITKGELGLVALSIGRFPDARSPIAQAQPSLNRSLYSSTSPAHSPDESPRRTRSIYARPR